MKAKLMVGYQIRKFTLSILMHIKKAKNEIQGFQRLLACASCAYKMDGFKLQYIMTSMF